MDAFSHLSVLISIILGLAITQLLQGFRGIVLARARVRLDWVPIAWSFIILLVCVQSWWAMFGLRQVRSWSFVSFSAVLLQVLAIYMQAAFVLPDFGGDAAIDLHAHYYDHVRWIFGAFVLTLVASLLKDVVLSGHLPEPLNVGFHLTMIALSVVAVLVRREWYHRLNAVAVGLGITAYIAVLFTRLP